MLSVVTLVLLGSVQGSGSPSNTDAAVSPHKYSLLRWEVDHFFDKWVNKFHDILPWNSEPSREDRIAQAEEFFELRAQIRELEREPTVGSATRIEDSFFKTLISDGRNFGPGRAPLVHGAA